MRNLYGVINIGTYSSVSEIFNLLYYILLRLTYIVKTFKNLP